LHAAVLIFAHDLVGTAIVTELANEDLLNAFSSSRNKTSKISLENFFLDHGYESVSRRPAR
jgi:hypothetical protein